MDTTDPNPYPTPTIEELEAEFCEKVQVKANTIVVVNDLDFDELELIGHSDYDDDDSDYEPSQEEIKASVPVTVEQMKANPQKYRLLGGGKEVKKSNNALRVGRSKLSKNLITASSVVNNAIRNKGNIYYFVYVKLNLLFR